MPPLVLQNMGYFPDGSFIPLGPTGEGQPSGYKPGQMPSGLRMLRTMSTPHIAVSQGAPMQPGMAPYSMYSMDNSGGQVTSPTDHPVISKVTAPCSSIPAFRKFITALYS